MSKATSAAAPKLASPAPAIACKCELQLLTANPLQFGACFDGLSTGRYSATCCAAIAGQPRTGTGLPRKSNSCALLSMSAGTSTAMRSGTRPGWRIVSQKQLLQRAARVPWERRCIIANAGRQQQAPCLGGAHMPCVRCTDDVAGFQARPSDSAPCRHELQVAARPT